MRRILVPVVVCLIAIGLFWWTSKDSGPLHDVSSDVRDCRENLQAIYDGLIEYQDRFGSTPPRAGVGFFAELIASGVWDSSNANIERLTCPGPGAEPVPAGTDYSSIDSLGPDASAYAGRDVLNHPLTKFPAGGPEIQALVACDNARGSNHEGTLNVLYSDRTVKTFEVDRLIEMGVLPPGASALQVGPESPKEELRTLTADR